MREEHLWVYPEHVSQADYSHGTVFGEEVQQLRLCCGWLWSQRWWIIKRNDAPDVSPVFMTNILLDREGRGAEPASRISVAFVEYLGGWRSGLLSPEAPSPLDVTGLPSHDDLRGESFYYHLIAPIHFSYFIKLLKWRLWWIIKCKYTYDIILKM